MNNRTREKIYKYKRYPHIDPKIHWQEVYRAVESPDYVSAHGFYPFIHYTQESFKYPKAYLSGAEEKRDLPKKREIMYSCHLDRYIYEYYAHLINCMYNERVKIDGTNKCAVAYRNNLHKNNIHFAKEAFDSIRRNRNAYILIGDFTGYFDNMSHAHLKKMLCSLLQLQCLPDDYYAVFRSITKYSYIELSQVKTYKSMDKKQFYAVERLFSPNEFHVFKKGNVHRNKNDYGIPQGSAISAVFSNVYLLDLDKRIKDFATSQGGFYRRYCDDFIVVLPDNGVERFVLQAQKILRLIDEIPNLTLQPQKAKAYHFSTDHVKNCSNAIFPEYQDGSDLINYLGFSFDGSTISIRQKTIAKYYRRMYRKADTIVAHGGVSPSGKRIPRSTVYRYYSKYGKNENVNTGNLSSSKHQGNFLSYIDRAEKVFGPHESITRDTRRAWEKLMKRLRPKPIP